MEHKNNLYRDNVTHPKHRLTVNNIFYKAHAYFTQIYTLSNSLTHFVMHITPT
jgi:hypothetical protein